MLCDAEAHRIADWHRAIWRTLLTPNSADPVAIRMAFANISSNSVAPVLLAAHDGSCHLPSTALAQQHVM